MIIFLLVLYKIKQNCHVFYISAQFQMKENSLLLKDLTSQFNGIINLSAMYDGFNDSQVQIKIKLDLSGKMNNWKNVLINELYTFRKFYLNPSSLIHKKKKRKRKE